MAHACRTAMLPSVLLATVVLLAAGPCAGEGAAPTLPLGDLVLADHHTPLIEITPQGFRIANRVALTARVIAAPDAFPCRVAPGPNPDVVQLSIGQVASRRCNSLYSPTRDEALTFEARDVELTRQAGGIRLQAHGPLEIRVDRDYMKVRRGLKWFTPLDKSVFPRAPAGWCSWYIYWQGITEDEMVKNADWLARNLRQFGCDIVQIDDGWQGVGHGSGENRDWHVTEAKKFPHGMKWLAAAIRARGFKPGIWLIPFTTSDEARFRAHPELFIRRADGTTIGETRDSQTGKLTVDWTGRYFIDASGAAGRQWFHDLFTMICGDWGYDYVKIDGQGGSRGAPERYRDRLADPKLAPDEVYRAGLREIKGVMGPGRFLLNCGGAYDSCGYCEGIRTGGDVGPSWEGMQPAITATMAHLYKNNIAFWTDPDVVCVRPRGNAGSSLSLEQARLWATLDGITGQLLMSSDRMYDLPEASVELLRRIYPVADIRPMELYPLAGRPRVFDLRVSRPDVGEWDVVALFNWDPGAPAQISLAPDDLGLPPGKYLLFDVWARQFLGVTAAPIALAVPASGCRLISWWPCADRPALLGSSRHLTQGADDLLAARWDPATGTWSGRSLLVGGDPYQLRFSLPPGWSCITPAATTDGAVAVLTLRREENGELPWSIAFRQGDATVVAPRLHEARLEGVGREVRLSWRGADAFAYRVYRDGTLLAQTATPGLTDKVPRAGQTYRYQVSAVGWEGESARVAAGEYTATPSPRGTAADAWLEQVRPLAAMQEYGSLERGRSVDRNPLTVGGKVYLHGLGSHAASELRYELGNRYARFEAEVGVDDEKQGAGTVVFRVFADGEQVFDSGVMRGRQAARKVSVLLAGVDELTLVVTDGGDGINCDHADWVDAKLIGNR